MIYVFLADGFEETEAITPIDMLRRAKLDVKLVGVGTSTPTSSHGIRVTADLTEAETKLDSSVQLIVLPGGMPGTLNLEKSPVVQSAIKYCVEKGIPVGAICAAPSILGKLGLLNGRKAVCFPGFEQYLTGAEVLNKLCVTDGQFTTACSAGAAIEFGLELVKVLCGEKRSTELRSAIVADR